MQKYIGFNWTFVRLVTTLNGEREADIMKVRISRKNVWEFWEKEKCDNCVFGITTD